MKVLQEIHSDWRIVSPGVERNRESSTIVEDKENLPSSKAGTDNSSCSSSDSHGSNGDSSVSNSGTTEDSDADLTPTRPKNRAPSTNEWFSVGSSAQNKAGCMKGKRRKICSEVVSSGSLRMMMERVTKDEINKFTETFFEGTDVEIKRKVTPMCHSKRFWLAVKFYNSPLVLAKVKSKVNLCEQLLGITVANVKKFFTVKDSKSKGPSDYDGLSPVENDPAVYLRFDVYFKFALNLEYIMKNDSRFTNEKMKGILERKIKNMGFDIVDTFESRRILLQRRNES